MYLNALSDINFVEMFSNLGGEHIRARIKPELFYSKQLLDTIRIDASEYVYYRLADPAMIGDKADRLVLRRWTPLQAHTVPLAEGIPPKSDKGAVMKYEIQAFPYGRYMEFTDRVDFEMLDPVVANYSKEYSIVAMETLDLLAREALMSNCSRYFAGGCASFADIYTPGTDGEYPDMRPKLADLRRIVLSMKRALVKPRSNGNFQVIGSPEFTFDMIDDPYVEKYMTINNTTKTMYSKGVLVPLFGMEFYETLVCPTTGLFEDGADTKCLTINTTTGELGTTGALSDNVAGYVTQDIGDRALNANDSRWGNQAKYPNIAGMETGPVGSLNAETDYMPAGAFKNIVGGLGQDEIEYKVQHILIIGDKALTRTGLVGQDSAQMHVKPLGSAGVLDPINQRQSIGFKINSVGFAVVESRSVVDYICVPTTVNSVQPVAPQGG